YMTQSGTIPIEPNLEPERILRKTHQQMQNNPPKVANLPRENSLFDEPLEQQAQL
ncbi:hypothetical protein J1N35_040559, partial [Gossypium stocksii]